MEEILKPGTGAAFTLKDQETVEDVTHAIRIATGGIVRGLKIESIENQIYITGSTDSYYHKQLVTRAALEVCEHNVLHNNVVVCWP